MSEWHKTGCVLCTQDCGLEILVEDNGMVKVRPDKDNPRSQGYAYGEVHGINANRLTKATNRDPIGTPLHRFVPCRIEAV